MPKVLTWVDANGKTQWAERKHIVYECDTFSDPELGEQLNVILVDCGTWVLEKKVREAGFLRWNEDWPKELQRRIKRSRVNDWR